MTLREIASEIRAHQLNDLERFRLAQAAAWFTEAFARTKRLPQLDKILRPASERSQEELENDRISKLHALAMVTGGHVTEVTH